MREDIETPLIEQAVQGDQAALERLMLLHHARLAGHLSRKLPDSVKGFLSVDDVLQETYVTVFRDITDFVPRGAGAFYRWLTKIAESRLFDAIKAENALKRGGGRRKVSPPAWPSGDSVVEWLEMLAVYERTPSQSAAGREAIAVVQSALASLKEDYREALRLRYIEGLPVAEAAARMNRTEGALCLLCHRGLKKMLENMGSSSQFFGKQG